MSTLETLTQRNQQFVSESFTAGLPLIPTMRTIVISCVDARVDPAHLLALKPGEAVVIRNIGGRITATTLQQMGMLQMITQIEGLTVPEPLSVIILHHTDCGITRLEQRPDALASYFGIDKADLPAKAVSDPRAAVRIDTATVRALPNIPKSWTIAGMVYHVETGHVETVVVDESSQS